MRTFSILSLLLLCCIFCGCNKNVSVTGQITFPDGSPLTEGNIIFESETFQGFSSINKEGRYSLGSIQEGDKVPKGQYKVRIIAVSGGGSDGTPLVRYVAQKYESVRTSGLNCDVEGNTEYNITVEKP
ncbi:MAG: hypothetical protein LBU65_03560 [Planctomycetaceae bacterium]|jgi:hypothetical protein|nr:hypothetical protein [Planctomycetaceae bacterium]